jgi:hypothetical protein
MKYNTGLKSRREEEGERYNIRDARQQQLGFMLTLSVWDLPEWDGLVI